MIQKNKIIAQVVTATPQLMEELKSKDKKNRNRKESHIKYLQTEIREGRWSVTNQGIGVSRDGFIVDGGHRIEAIIREGCPPVQFVLVTGLPESAQKYVDIGAKRSMADILTLFFNSQINSKIVAVLNVILKKDSKWQSWKYGPDVYASYFQKYALAFESIFAVKGIAALPAPVVAAFVDEIASGNSVPSRTIDFAQQVTTGELIQQGDPAYALRNFISNNTGSAAAEIRTKFLKSHAALVAFLENRRISRLRTIE